MADSLPSISHTESLILDLLRGRPRYGLELVDRSEGALKRGSVYVLLTRMEAKGFVTSKLDDGPTAGPGPTRRLYTATPYGLKVHRAYGLLREALALKPQGARS